MVLTDKNSVLKTARSYASSLSSAADHCAAAAKALIDPQYEVTNNWRGESGAAMAAKLDALRFEINQIYGQLVNASAQVSARGQAVYNAWPEDKTEDKK